MSLGNPVRYSDQSDRPVVMIPVKLDLRDNRAFWRRNVFAIPKSGLLGWLFKLGSKAATGFSLGCRWKPGSRQAIAGWFQVSRGSVDEVLYNITDKLIIGTANGS
jgi:hypothetical protein